jgi:predicted ATPase
MSQPVIGSRLFILTGAPGSGKTAILDGLREHVRCIDEPARAILAEQRATGGRGTWDQDPPLFVALLLEHSIEAFRAAHASGETVVFDRGIPDCVEYAARADADRRPIEAAVERFRYHPRVLFLEPWRAIYTTDDERIMTFEDTIMFGDSLRNVYERSGYELVEIPRGAIDDRVAYVLRFIAEAPS